MPAILRFDNDAGWFDLALDDNNRLVEADGATADPLVTEMLLALYTEAPADVGDPVTPGSERLPHWGVSFDPAETVRGSKLWMIPFCKPASKALALAPIWAEEALGYMVTRGAIASVAASATLVGKIIKLRIEVALNSGDRKAFTLSVAFTN